MTDINVTANRYSLTALQTPSILSMKLEQIYIFLFSSKEERIQTAYNMSQDSHLNLWYSKEPIGMKLSVCQDLLSSNLKECASLI